MSDTLYYYTHNQMINVRYYDVVNKSVKIDNRSGDEIAYDIMSRYNLKFEEEDPSK